MCPSEPARSTGGSFDSHHAGESRLSLPRSSSQARLSRHSPLLAQPTDAIESHTLLLHIAELDDFGATIHSLSLSNQTFPLKKGFYIDQAHAAQVRISLDEIINCGWCPYLL